MRKKNSTKEKRPLRIAGYVRVSSQRQATEGDSLVAQEHEIEQEVEFRKRRENWDIGSLEFYVDAGRSAKDQNRPQLQRLKRDIAAGNIDLVICFKLDRITRSLKDFVDLWALFDEHDVDVISLREKFDTSMPTGEAMIQLIMVFAQLERKMTAERTVSILKDRADRGLWNGGHILGYKSVKHEPGRLEIDEDGAAIVRRIFELYDKHGTAGAVTRELSDLGIRYPTFETRSGKIRGGKLFTKQKVVGILRNPVYIGKMRWGETEYDGNHPALIGAEQFERVNASLTAMVKRRINVRQPSARTYLLSGLLRCSCGAHLVGASASGSRGKSYYYVCTRQTHEGGKYSCSAPRIPAIALETAVIGRIRELGRVLEARERIVREAVAHLDGETERMQDQSEVLRRQLAKNRADTGRLVEVLKSMGAKALSSVQSELERLDKEGEALESQLAVLSKQKAPVERITNDARKFVETWEDIGEVITAATDEERRELLQHYIEVIELRSTDPKGRTGTYALRLFPEVRPDRTFDWDETDAISGLQMTNGDDTPEDGIAVLTQDARVVRTTSGKLPVAGTSGSFRGKVLRLENRYYHTVYVDRVRMYVPGRSPEPQRKTKVRRSRLRIRADYAPIRNVIAIARQYEAYLKEPGIYTYRQAAEHFSTSKVTVGYHLALLTRLPADFVSWLEACTEELPMTFFSLRRLRPVTMMSEPERKGALLELARTLVREMEGQPSEAVPELLWMLDEELHQMPRRLLRSIMLD